MKRKTRAWLKFFAGTAEKHDGDCAADALDSDARQRAEIRDLKKRLKLAEELVLPLVDWEHGEGTRGEVVDPLRDVLSVLDLKKPLKEKR